MKHIIKFSKLLNEIIDIETLEIEVSTYYDIISALYNMIPTLSKLKNEKLALIDGDIFITLNDLNRVPKNKEIFLVPTFGGSSTIDSFGNLEMFYGTNTAMSANEVYMNGINKRILDSSLFGQAKTAYDIAQRTYNRNSGKTDGNNDPSTGFGSLTHTSLVGQAIPLTYGMVRTSGAIINQFTRNIQNDLTETIYDIESLLGDQ